MTISQMNRLSERKATMLARSVFAPNFYAVRWGGRCYVHFTTGLMITNVGKGASWVEAFAAARAATGLVSK